MSRNSAYNRPQREVLSLKTIDIPGAMGKSKIYEKKLIYDQGKSHAGGHIIDHNTWHQSKLYGHDRRMYEDETSIPSNLPDPYELEASIQHSAR